MLQKNDYKISTKRNNKEFSKKAENTTMRILALSLMIVSLWSCAKSKFESQLLSEVEIPSGQSDQGTEDPNTPPTTPPPPSSFKFQPLAWESRVSGSANWSNYIYTIIRSEEPQMLGQNVADDIETFCPQYRSLSDDQRLNFWGQLFAGMAKFESSWNPTTRYTETTMGIDPVTGNQVVSEGLLQLSYQDEISYSMDCGFDWSKDKLLSHTDPKKTIFSPYNNLRCGIKIMARQLRNKRAITLTSGIYWAVLSRNGTWSKIPEIAAITKTLNFCN